MTDTNQALMALMDLVLAIADYVTTPPGHRGNATDRVRAERRAVEGRRETLYLMGTEANRRRLEAAVKQKAAMEADTMEKMLNPARWHQDMLDALERRQERATGLLAGIERLGDGLAARAAVAATERRLRAWQGLDPIEADDSRVTDGHQCCGGKPDCGCSRSVGG